MILEFNFIINRSWTLYFKKERINVQFEINVKRDSIFYSNPEWFCHDL